MRVMEVSDEEAVVYTFKGPGMQSPNSHAPIVIITPPVVGPPRHGSFMRVLVS